MRTFTQYLESRTSIQTELIDPTKPIWGRSGQWMLYEQEEGDALEYLRKAVEKQINKNPYVLASWLEANGDDEVKDMIKEYKNRRGNEPEGERGLGDLSNDNLEGIKSPPEHPDSSNSNAFGEY